MTNSSEAGRTPLVFTETGNGASLTELHGFPLNRTTWRPRLAAPAAGHIAKIDAAARVNDEIVAFFAGTASR